MADPNRRTMARHKSATGHTGHHFRDAVDDFIETRPYTALFGMFTLGFLYALMRR